MLKPKQVIVMRKFPSLRTGKYVAQGAHASMGSFLKLGHLDAHQDNFIIPLYNVFVREWLLGSFTKVTLQADTQDESELVAIHEAAKAAGLPTALIVDSGLTEFNGVPTTTAVGIGPAEPDLIDKITGHLKLF